MSVSAYLVFLFLFLMNILQFNTMQLQWQYTAVHISLHSALYKRKGIDWGEGCPTLWEFQMS